MTRPILRTVLPLAIALALSACGGQPEGLRAPAPGTAGSKTAIDPKSIQTPYAAIAAGKVDIEGGLVDIAARSQGIVQEVLVEEGDRVKTGQVLARQEDEDSRLSRDRVAAQLAQSVSQVPVIQVQIDAAKREEARLKRLLDSNAASTQAFDQAADHTKQLQAQLDSQVASVALSKAQLSEANYQVELHIVRAPASGRIVRRYANPGMGASTLNVTPMFQLQPDAQRIVRAEVEERSLTSVKVGQKVDIVPESDQDRIYPGKVIRIAEVMGSRKLLSDDPSQRTDERVVEVVVDAEQAEVLVGQRMLVKFLRDGAPAGEAKAAGAPTAAEKSAPASAKASVEARK